MKKPTTIAIDLSKSVFEVAVERQGRVCQRRRLNRRQLAAFLSECPRAKVLMETCGSSHYWGRVPQGFGHTVGLLPAQYVRKYRIGQKTDRRDAEAILKAHHHDRIVPVPVKTIKQQTIEEIPGIALLNATAFSALVGNLRRFRSGRRFSSSLGLTPKESSSGKRRWLGSISKAGDPYLRTLLIGGARSMLLAAHRTKRPHRLQAWPLEVERRRRRNRAAMAVTSKLARIVWAVAPRGAPYRSTPLEARPVEDARA